MSGSIPLFYLCPTCLDFTEREKIQENCPNCGQPTDPDIFVAYRGGRKAMKYGVYARDTYERQLEEKGDIRTHYYGIEPSEILNWIVTYIIPGIIATATYEAIKETIKAIIKKAKQHPKLSDKALSALEESDEENTRLITRINDWQNGLKNVDNKVRDAILEEKVIDSITETAMSSIQETNHNSAEAIVGSIRQGLQNDRDKDLEEYGEFISIKEKRYPK